MESMTNNNNGNNETNKNSDNSWLGFSLSPQMKGSPPSSQTTHSSSSNPMSFFNLPSLNFNYPSIYCNGVEGENGGGLYSAFPIMPLKSDGSLCLLEAITRSHSQGMVATTSTPPKLENFFGGVTMGTSDMGLSLDSSALYYPDQETLQHNHRHHQHQIQPQHYQDYSEFRGFYQQEEIKEAHLPTIKQDDDITGMKNWISRNYGDLESLSLSMSHGCSQSNSFVTSSEVQVTPAASVINSVAMDTKKRGAEKVDQQKQIVHRKSLDTFGQRTSQYRGVTRHRWTGRYEAHLWDNTCKKEGQSRKGRQVYLGGYDTEEKAARAYDSAALKYWGSSTHINFPLENYEQELEDMKNMSRQEYVAHLRRRSSGFSRGASIYRGVTRHHQHGRWQARIGRVAGNKDLYLGTFSTQEEAAEAYDVAAIKFRGVNAVTNFDISRYNVERIMASNTLLAGDLARRTKELDPTTEHLSSQVHNNGEPKNPSSETMGTPLSKGSSVVTSLSINSRDRASDNLPMAIATPMISSLKHSSGNGASAWIPTTAAAQLRAHIPVFAAWTDA